MMLTALLIAIVLVLNECQITLSTKNKVIAECEKKAHNSLSPQQRSILCQYADIEYGLGPAICSLAAKDSLHLPFENLLKICQHASSSAPVDCLKKLEMTVRQKSGFDLCAQATNSFPAECYSQLTQTYNVKPIIKQQLNKLKSTQIVEFCREVDELAPIHCFLSSINSTTISLDDGLAICKNAIGYGNFKPEQQQVVSQCIAELSSFLTSQKLLITSYNHVKHSGTVNHRVNNVIAPEDVVKFCVNINYHSFPNTYATTVTGGGGIPLPAVECVQTLHTRLQELSRTGSAGMIRYTGLLKTYDKLQICKNAPTTTGPVNCTIHLFERLTQPQYQQSSSSSSSSSGAGGDKLTGEDVAGLCQGTVSPTGPGDCFLESKSISSSNSNNGNLTERIQLCHGASNAGPAYCYRKAITIFRHDIESRMILCMEAISEGPAACVVEAPQYLSNEEKIHLCSSAPMEQYNDPLKCLQSVQSTSRTYPNAPKRTLGYPLEGLSTDAEWTSRALLISLCSFSDSSYPLFSAQCLKNIPRNIPHDEAILLCTNTTNINTNHHLTYCTRILSPLQIYNITQIHMLCQLPTVTIQQPLTTPSLRTNNNQNKKNNQKNTDTEHIEAIVTCAAYLAKHLIKPLGMLFHPYQSTSSISSSKGTSGAYLLSEQFVTLCQQETTSNMILTCVKEIGHYIQYAHPVFSTNNNINIDFVTSNAWNTASLLTLCGQENALLSTTSNKLNPSGISTKNSVCMITMLQDYLSYFPSASVYTIDVNVFTLFIQLCHHTTVASMQRMLSTDSTNTNNSVKKGQKHASYSQKVLKCLSTRQSSQQRASLVLFSVEDIAICQNPMHYQLHTVRVKQLYNREEDILHIKNNQYFTIVMELYDQYNTLYVVEELDHSNSHSNSNSNSDVEVPQFEISINANNIQNAILWGIRRNNSMQGSLTFHSLMISQPGNVTVQITRNVMDNNNNGQQQHEKRKEIIFSFVLMIAVNEKYQVMSECLSLFQQSVCPYISSSSSLLNNATAATTCNLSQCSEEAISLSEDDSSVDLLKADTIFEHDMQSLYPLVRSYHPNQYYLLNAHCFGSHEMFHHDYHMLLSLLPSGQLFLEYRIGIDSIWTGIGLPRLEMTPIERLQLINIPSSETLRQSFEATMMTVKSNLRQKQQQRELKQQMKLQKDILKKIKRAYYKMSLMWHPDRWAAYSTYSPLVQNIFPLISEAYEALVSEYTILTNDGDSTISGSNNQAANKQEENRFE